MIPSPSLNRWLCVGAGAGYAFFVIVVVAFHVAYVGEPRLPYLSEYALGPYGILMDSAFLASGMGTVALGVALARGMSPSLFTWITSLLICLAGVVTCLMAVFPTGLGPAPAAAVTPESVLHVSLAALRVLASVLATATWSLALRRDPRGPRMRPLALGGSITTVVVYLLCWTVLGANIGLGQRIWVVANLGWAALVIHTMLQPGHESHAPSTTRTRERSHPLLSI